jgi:lipopolysaccharide export system permease protein
MRISTTLSTYLGKSFLLWFSVFMLTIIGLILLFDFSETMRQASGNPDISVSTVMTLVLLKLPFLLEQLLPFIVLFSCMFTLWRLNRGSEIIVMRAAGISIWQILAPIAFASLMIGLFDLTTVNPMTATFLNQYEKLKNQEIRGYKDGIAISETGIWLRNREKNENALTLRIGHVDFDAKTIHNVSLFEYVKEDDDALNQRIDAESGVFIDNGILFKNAWISPAGGQIHQQDQYFLSTNIPYSRLHESNLSPDSLSFWQLPSYIHLLKRSGLDTRHYSMQWHSLLARAFWLAAMVVLAAMWTLRPVRQGGTYLLLAFGAGTGFILYFIRDITFAMGQAGTLPLILCAWLPVILSAVIGSVSLLYQEDG